MNENLSSAPITTSTAASATVDGCPPAVAEGECVRWFALRSSYCREMKALELLQRDGFECYVPVRTERIEKNGVVVHKEVPVVHNLIFVHSARDLLTPWKRLHEADAALRYIIDKATDTPMIVPDRAMNDFIRVTRDSNDVLYLDDPSVCLTAGQRVEVIAGPFKGVQGQIVRIRRDRRVVINVEGLIAVALASMPREWFKLLS